MTNGQQALPGRAEPAAVRPTSNIVDPTRLLVASAVCQSVRPLDTTSGRALTARSVAASLERAPAAPARPPAAAAAASRHNDAAGCAVAAVVNGGDDRNE